MSLNITQDGKKLNVDSSGNLLVAMSGGGGGGTQYVDGVTQATPTGTAILGKNAANVLHALSLDASGNLNMNLAAGSISGGNIAASPTEAAVPAAGDYIAAKDGSGNLKGLLVESTANPNLRVALFNGATELGITGTSLQVDASATLSLPLPTGAATLAKQPALGVAGTASADVITVQGIASMTPLLVTASQGTAAALAGRWPVIITDGTNTMPTGDAIARTIHMTVDNATLAVQDTADGTVGLAAPTIAQLAGFRDGNNLLRAPSVDGQGNVNLSPSGIEDRLQLLLLETRAMRYALIALVCDGAKFKPADFLAASYQSEIMSESELS